MPNWWNDIQTEQSAPSGENWWSGIDTKPKQQAPEAGDPNMFKSGPATPDNARRLTSQEIDQDIAKSVLTGGRRFLEGTVGAPGLLEEYAGKGVDLAAEALGSDYRYPRMLPNPEEVGAAVEKVMPERLKPYLSHTPQTPQGQVAEIGMEVVPGFIGLGAGGARRAAALARAPTQEQLAQATRRAYDVLDQAGIRYDPQAYTHMAGLVQQQLKNANLGTEARALVDTLTSRAQMTRLGSPVEFEAMETFYQQAGDILRNRNSTPADMRAARIIQRDLDNFRGQDRHLMTGNMPAAEAAQRIRGARALAARNIKTRELEGIEATANELNPQERAPYINAQIKKIMTNPNLRRLYTRDELDALRRTRRTSATEFAFARGGPIGSAIRQGVGAPAGAALGAAIGGPAGGVAGGLVGSAITGGIEAGARAAADARRARALLEAQQTMRAGPGAVPPVPPRGGVAVRGGAMAGPLATAAAPAMALVGFDENNQPIYVPSPTGGQFPQSPEEAELIRRQSGL